MVYKIRQINVIKLLLITIAVIIGSCGTSIYLNKIDYLTSDNPFFFILIFGGIAAAFAHLFYWQHGTLICEITDKYIKINEDIFPWIELKKYKIRDDSPEFKTIRLKSMTGKSFTIGHRKKHESEDDFEKFLRAFQRKVKHFNSREEQQIEQIPLIWDTKFGKFYGYVIIVFILAATVFMFVGDFKTKMLANYLILCGISLPILFRIFKG